MSHYALTLFGEFSLTVDGQSTLALPTNKTGALLAYLALGTNDYDHKQTRRNLASLLWPDLNSKSALQNLRNNLYYLRRLIQDGTRRQDEALIWTTRDTIGLQGALEIDVLRFQERLDSVSTHSHTRLVDCAHCEQKLVEAVHLYRGELLAGLSLADAPPFEEWLLLRRELYHQKALLAVSHLVEIYERRGSWAAAHQFAGMLLELDVFREESHQALMRILAAQGIPGQALHHYEKLRHLLQEELGVEPHPETVALVRRIAEGAFEKRPMGQQPSPDERTIRWQPTQVARNDALATPLEDAAQHAPVPIDLSEVPDTGHFFGRAQERQQLAQWLLRERCCVVAVLGLGGVGKTSLVAHCVRTLVNDNTDLHPGDPIDAILWRSLVNAPALEELLPSLLQTLAAEPLAEMPASLDAQLRLLLGYLRNQRVLLVLDNWESILEPEQAGVYRPGYAPYGQLLEQMATLEHRSHLLLTSRERPRNYARLESGNPCVRSLQLMGLDDAAAHELLTQRDLRGTHNEETLLVTRYSGNPLALKLVADVVDELFDGHIVEFLAEDGLVFDNIRTVLEQQFERLSPLEEEILIWLAVERAAIPAPQLRENLLQPPTGQAFLEALRNLRRRSLLERQESGFTLQNVITEYVTERLVQEAVAELESGTLVRLHRHALLKAEAQENVRLSQERLLVRPVATRLMSRMGIEKLSARIRQLLDGLRVEAPRLPGYAGGNLCNLLRQLPIDMAEYDFSQLAIWQAHFQGALLSGATFAGADLAHSTFTQSFGQVSSTAISPDEQLLASGAESGDITLWSLHDYQPLMVLRGHSNSVSELAFSPDGRRLTSSSIDATIRCWDLQTGQTLWQTQGDERLVFSVAISPDGRLIASGGQDAFVYLWESASGKPIYTLTAHRGGPTRAVAFHPDGSWLAAASLGGAIFLWDMKAIYDSINSPKLVQTGPDRLTIPAADGESFITVAFSHDGTLLASGDDRGVIKLWDLQTRKNVGTLPGHEASVRSLAFTPDGKSLVSGSFDRTMRLWDVARTRCEAIFAHNGVVFSTTLSATGNTLVSAGEDSILRLWHIQPPRRTELVRMIQGYRCYIPAADFSPSANLVAIGDTLGTIRLWDIDQQTVRYMDTLQGHERVDALAFSPDGRILASAGGMHDHAIRLWDVATQQCLAVLAGHTQRVRSLVFTPDGTLLASAGRDCTIRLWDVQDSKDCRLLHMLDEHQNMIFNLSFNRDGTRLASSSHDNTIRLWETATGQQLHCIPGRGGNEALAFSPSANIIACSAGDGGGIRFVDGSDPQSEKPLIILQGHAHEPVSISFHPGGKQLVSGSSDHSVRLWDVEQERTIYVLNKHRAYVDFVRFSPNGQHFISSSIDGVAYLWQTETGRCLHTFHALRPYEGMNITGVTGISKAQRAALKALGAVERE